MKFNEVPSGTICLFQTTLANPAMQWFMGKVLHRTTGAFIMQELIGLQIDQQGTMRPFPMNPFADGDSELEIKDTNILNVVEAPKQFQDEYQKITSGIEIASADTLNSINTKPKKKM